MLRKILKVLAIAFILIQFIQIDKTSKSDETFHMSTKYNMPEEVSTLLKMLVTIAIPMLLHILGIVMFNQLGGGLITTFQKPDEVSIFQHLQMVPLPGKTINLKKF